MAGDLEPLTTVGHRRRIAPPAPDYAFVLTEHATGHNDQAFGWVFL